MSGQQTTTQALLPATHRPADADEGAQREERLALSEAYQRDLRQREALRIQAQQAPGLVPSTALGDLLAWLNDPANRVAWYEARCRRLDEQVDASIARTAVVFSNPSASGQELDELQAAVKLARERVELAALVEDFAERSRVRITATVRRPEVLDAAASSAEPIARICTLTGLLLRTLGQRDFAAPAEVVLAVQYTLAALAPGYQAPRNAPSPAALRAWADALDLALAATTSAPARN
ncbi:hypothetical protein ACGF12_13655 [Kitasatospora sp. NPDC048296]|uniref:hypothetical protein n=1 Tax=Kitasatospora sp. NPDC048296 TaxID=3364048 RepID=UPI003718BF37